MFHPFSGGRPGACALTDDLTGFVEDITLRHTAIRTLTNSRMIIPEFRDEQGKNGKMPIMETARLPLLLDVSVAYESNLELAMEVMAKVIGEHPLYCGRAVPPKKKNRESQK